MIVIAHRGASAELPENTLSAFERAVELGADMIELDVRATRDGVLYVAHDPVTGAVRGSLLRRPRPSWAEVAEAAAREGSGAGGLYPPLGEVLDRFASRIALNLEVKERGAAALLGAELVRRGLREGVLVSSFDRRTLRLVRRAGSDVELGLLAVRRPLRLAAVLASVAARSFHPKRTAANPAVVRAAHRAGARVLVWTVDDLAEMRRLAAWGVDGVFTNDPRAAVRVFKA